MQTVSLGKKEEGRTAIPPVRMAMGRSILSYFSKLPSSEHLLHSTQEWQGIYGNQYCVIQHWVASASAAIGGTNFKLQIIRKICILVAYHKWIKLLHIKNEYRKLKDPQVVQTNTVPYIGKFLL